MIADLDRVDREVPMGEAQPQLVLDLDKIERLQQRLAEVDQMVHVGFMRAPAGGSTERQFGKIGQEISDIRRELLGDEPCFF